MAVEVVEKLARAGALRSAIAEAGAVGALVALLRRQEAGGTKLKTPVVRLIAELCEEPAVASREPKATILGTGGIAALLAALQGPGAVEGGEAAILGALLALATRSGEAVGEVLDAGGREALEMFASSLPAAATESESGDGKRIPSLVEALQRCLDSRQTSPTRELSFSATELSLDAM